MDPFNNALFRASGTSVDTSSYPRAGVTPLQPPPNPLQAASQVTGVMQQMQQLDSSKFDLLKRQQEAMSNVFSSILADPTQKNVIQRSSELRALGIPADRIASGLAEFSQAGNNPEGIKRIAIRHLSQLASIQERLQLGGAAPPVLHNNGNVAIPVAPGSGLNQGIQPAAGPVIPNQIGPEGRTGMVEVTLPDGSKRQISRGQLFDNSGTPYGAGGGQPVQPSPRSTVRGDSGGGSRGPGAAMGVPAPPAAPGAISLGPDGIVSANSPVDMADQGASAQAFIRARDDIEPSRGRTTTMRLALDAVRGTNVGLGTTGRQKLLNAINSLPGGIGKILVPDDKGLSDYEVGMKYLAGVQATADGASRSDAALALAQASNPNVSMVKPAIIETGTTAIGREVMRQAQTLDYINSKRSPAEYSNHTAKEWSKFNDPKAYALGSMTPEERTQLVSKIKPADRQRFFASVRKGLETGVLSRDDLVGVSAAPAPGGR